METTTVHPNQSLLEQQSNSFRRMSRLVAHWVETTESDKVAWVPGEAGVSKARTILDQMEELVGINSKCACKNRGETPAEGEKRTLSTKEEACAALIESSDALADSLLALGPEALDVVSDTFAGPMPLKDFNEIILMNLCYHGGVVNAYQLMYGDEVFHFPQ